MTMGQFLSLVILFLSVSCSAMIELGEQFQQEGLTAGLIKNFLSKVNERIAPLRDQELDNLAIGYGYGYKTANLFLLRSLIEKIPFKDITGIDVQIPQCVGITTQEIKFFLYNKGLDLDSLWLQLLSRNYQSWHEAEQAFLTKKFSEFFLRDLEWLHDRVQESFIGFVSFDQLPIAQETREYLRSLLKQAQENNKKLMVRSTGREDTDKLANAGGNDSLSNIDPTEPAVIEALGSVIASYFSSKSIKQRLGAGDRTLFSDSPFIPAVVQLMVGEKRGGSTVPQLIPRSGVMFTEEPEGRLSTAINRSKTSGISIIQAAYGHNEGVVNSIVAVDTYYVDLLGHIHSVIVPKPSRMIPLEPRGLGRQENEASLMKKSTLNEKAVATLKLLAVLFEWYYQKPMDVEYVLLGNTLSLVQARPIVHNPYQLRPCYLRTSDVLKEKLFGNSIGVAGGQLRVLSSLNQCIIEDTLSKALAVYQDASITSNPHAISCVIVGEMAPATSHEATTFRGELKPVFYVNNLAQVKQWFSAGVPVIADLQRGVIGTWDVASHGPVEQLQHFINALQRDEPVSSPDIVAGWVSYPIPDKLSTGFMSSREKNRLATICKDESSLQAFLEQWPRRQQRGIVENIGIHEVINRLKEANDASEANDYLHILLIKLLKTFKTYEASGLWNLSDMKGMYDALVYHVLLCFEALNTLFLQGAEKIQRLYVVKFLEAAFLQESPEIVGGYSYVTLLARLAKLSKAEADLQGVVLSEDVSPQERQRTAVYLTFAKQILNDDVRMRWQHFINGLAQENDQQILGDQRTYKAVFSHLMHNLAGTDLLPMWLNFSFANARGDTPMAIAKVLVDEYLAAEPFLKTLQAQRQKMDSINLNVLADPTKFKLVWDEFIKVDADARKTSLFDYFTSDDSAKFLGQFVRQNDLAKLYALDLMGRFVDKFDLGIKVVSGSALYKKESFVAGEADSFVNKMYAIKTMLINYTLLLSKWLTLAREWERAERPKCRSAIARVNAIVPYSSHLLNLTRSFNVATAAVGSQKNFYFTDSSLEDLFTFAHQSLLNIIGSLFLQNRIVERIALPEDFLNMKNFQDRVEIRMDIGKGEEIFKPVFVGFNFSHGMVSYFFNIPLRNHSAKIFLSFDSGRKEKFLKIELYGQDGSQRWERIIDFVELAGVISGFENKNLVALEKSCSFTWMIPQHFSSILGEKIQIFLRSILKTSFEINQERFIEQGRRGWLVRLGIDEHDREQVTKAARAIISLSVTKNRAHWLLREALNVLTKDATQADVWEHLLKILNNLYPYSNEYSRRSFLFLYNLNEYEPASLNKYDKVVGFALEERDTYGIAILNYLQACVSLFDDGFKNRLAVILRTCMQQGIGSQVHDVMLGLSFSLD